MQNRKALIAAVVLILVLTVAGYLLYPTLTSGSELRIFTNSIAVLPFQNMSNDSTQEYFSDGMMDDILAHLYKIGDLKVISRTSSMLYKHTNKSSREIASELDVATLLQGSVQREGGRVRIRVQLINGKTDTQLWAETYERSLEDVFSIQSEIAQRIAVELKSKLTNETISIQQKPTRSQLAYDLYLKGKDHLSRIDIGRSIEMLTKAVEVDSSFALAYATRAFAHFRAGWYRLDDWEAHFLQAGNDLKKARELDRELPEVKIGEASTHYFVNRDYDRALTILSDLKNEVPGNAELYSVSSFILRRMGRLEESKNELSYALTLDPLNVSYIHNHLQTFMIKHQYDSAITFARNKSKFTTIDTSFLNGIIFRALLAKEGNFASAAKESGLNKINRHFAYSGVYYDPGDPDYYAEKYDALIKKLDNETDNVFSTQKYFYPITFEYARVYYNSGNTALCKTYADSTIAFLANKLKGGQDDNRIYAVLGTCHAWTGNVELAITYGRKAVELMPVKFDLLDGLTKEQDLALIYVYTGEYDLAMDKIEFLLSSPSYLSVGQLLANPSFKKLRDLPRFQKLVVSIKSN